MRALVVFIDEKLEQWVKSVAGGEYKIACSISSSRSSNLRRDSYIIARASVLMARKPDNEDRFFLL